MNGLMINKTEPHWGKISCLKYKKERLIGTYSSETNYFSMKPELDG